MNRPTDQSFLLGVAESILPAWYLGAMYIVTI
jgi:hypothetical protein